MICTSTLLRGNCLPNLHWTFSIQSSLPKTKGPVACHQATDNSTADAASAKGLTMTKALAVMFPPYFTLMRRFQFFPHISHIPGRLNVLADEVSRFKQHLSTPLDPDGRITIPWKELLCSSGIQVTQNGRKWPSHFNIQPRDKKVAAVSRLGASIDCFLGNSYSGWSIVDKVWCLGNSPPKCVDLNIPRFLGCLIGFALGCIHLGQSVQTGPAGSF